MKKIILLLSLFLSSAALADTVILDCRLGNADVYRVTIYKKANSYYAVQTLEGGKLHTSTVTAKQVSEKKYRLTRPSSNYVLSLSYGSRSGWYATDSNGSFSETAEAQCK